MNHCKRCGSETPRDGQTFCSPVCERNADLRGSSLRPGDEIFGRVIARIERTTFPVSIFVRYEGDGLPDDPEARVPGAIAHFHPPFQPMSVFDHTWYEVYR